jgi:hypothetical protein
MARMAKRAMFLLVAAPAAALAMSIRTTRTPLAHAPDGATLFEVREMGPEGGGALTYRVEGNKTAGVDFLVSSDFSPGGPTRPQTVPAETCRQRLAALEAELAKHRFAGVTVRPDGCRAKSRTGLVTVKP